jgi:hypothetical protein
VTSGKVRGKSKVKGQKSKGKKAALAVQLHPLPVRHDVPDFPELLGIS